MARKKFASPREFIEFVMELERRVEVLERALNKKPEKKEKSDDSDESEDKSWLDEWFE